MATLNEKINNAIMTLHQIHKKEWITLKEIYSEVEFENKNENINPATIRDAIEKGCIRSTKFSGNEMYISKEKLSGLYKSIYYEQLKFISNINIGDIFTREQLMAIFKISGQSGMMKTNTLNCLVLTTSEYNGVYEDGVVQNGTIIYTGEGLEGDQSITKNNKTLYESRETNVPVYLFTKDKLRRYIFEGRVELYGEPYQIPEKDINGNERLVWKFPLKVIYNENADEDFTVKEISYEIVEIENKFFSKEESELNELKYVEGPLNIRKYRKTGKHIQRSSKPDFIAQEIIKNKQGVINEKYIYEKELQRLYEEEAHEQIKLMEEFFANKKENEGYDILSFEIGEKGQYVEKYIEVKSTKGNEGTPIDITIDEIDFAREHINNYYLYRIIYSDSDKRYLKIVKGRELLETYNFIPVTFKIYSK